MVSPEGTAMHTRRLLIFCSLISSSLSLADEPVTGSGLDRDSLLTEAPATPERGNVRISAGGNSSYLGAVSGGITGTAMWTPFTHFAADVSGYWQDGDAGPALRVRYQFLSQALHGIDLAAGVRYKSVGFDPRNGELEVLLAGGHRFGRLGTVLNVVGGTELGGPGLDVEVKALVDYRLLENLRVGLDARLQAEVHDEEGWKAPGFADDIAVVGGAVLGWFPISALQLQLLVGATHPRGLTVGPTARLLASFDF
jgi:hypothetical protein